MLLAAFLSTGCMAFIGRSEFLGSPYPVYRGVTGGYRLVQEIPFVWLILLVDLPATFVVDTLLFPCELAWWLSQPDETDQESGRKGPGSRPTESSPQRPTGN